MRKIFHANLFIISMFLFILSSLLLFIASRFHAPPGIYSRATYDFHKNSNVFLSAKE